MTASETSASLRSTLDQGAPSRHEVDRRAAPMAPSTCQPKFGEDAVLLKGSETCRHDRRRSRHCPRSVNSLGKASDRGNAPVGRIRHRSLGRGLVRGGDSRQLSRSDARSHFGLSRLRAGRVEFGKGVSERGLTPRVEGDDSSWPGLSRPSQGDCEAIVRTRRRYKQPLRLAAASRRGCPAQGRA